MLNMGSISLTSYRSIHISTRNDILRKDIDTLHVGAKKDMLDILDYIGRGILCNFFFTPKCHNLDVYVC